MAPKQEQKRERPPGNTDSGKNFKFPREQRKNGDGTTQTARDKSTFQDQSTSSELVLPEPQRLCHDYRLL